MPFNGNNPYDSTGIVHNNLLEYLINYIPADDTSGTGRASALKDGIYSLYDSLGLTMADADSLIQWISNNFHAGESQQWLNSYIANYSSPRCTQRELGYIHQIGQAFEVATDSAGIMNALLSIEYAMVHENWEEEETIALGAISIAKNSTYSALTKQVGGCLSAEIYACSVDYTSYLASMDADCDRKKAERSSAGMSAVAYALYICWEHWNPEG
ncbi:MAG: hypothetical protein M5R41_13840 [Bacteroidia bacterium]|nr:hypothetical protein [Bacteroidia bacterium]